MNSSPFRHRLSTRTACILLLVFPLFWNCKGQQTPPRGEGGVVARVGGAVLTLEALEASIPESIAQQISAEEKREMAERWVEKQLLYQEAVRRGIERDPWVEQWVEQAKVDLVVSTLIKRELEKTSDITEEEIARYYEEHQDEFVQENNQIRAQYIQVESEPRARDLYRRLSAGETFENLLTEEVATEIQSGDLGYFSQGDVEEEVWRTVSTMKVGSFSQPVRIHSGYHLIQVLDRKQAGTIQALDQVRARIMGYLLFERQKEQADRLVRRLRTEIPYELHTELLRNDAEP